MAASAVAASASREASMIDATTVEAFLADVQRVYREYHERKKMRRERRATA